VTLALPPRFDLEGHAGPLPLRIEVQPGAPFALAGSLAARGALRVDLELYLERFEQTIEGGLEEVPAVAAHCMRVATFCAVLTVSAAASAGACAAAFFAAVGLARAADGVVVDLEEGLYWEPDEALQQAERYLTDTMRIAERAAAEVSFAGWSW
jgi:hypothetical protein